MAKFTLDELKSAITAEHEAFIVQLDAKHTVEFRNLLTLPDGIRKTVMEAMKDSEGAKDDESGDAIDKVRSSMIEVLRLVATDELAFEHLIEDPAISTMAGIKTLFTKWSKGTQAGEAKPSRS